MHIRTYVIFFFFFNDTATTEIYTLSLHDALPISFDAAVERRVLRWSRAALDARQLGLGERECPSHALEQRGAMPARQRGGKLGDERELRGRSWEGLRDRDAGVVPDDPERGLILLRREHLAPAVQLTQRRERARGERSGPLHPQERVGGVRRAGPAQGFEGRELFLRPAEAAGRCETVSQRVPQGRQVLGA